MKTRFAMVVCALAAAVLPAAAQDTPKIDISGGYSFLRNQTVEENFNGWVGSVAGNFSPSLGVVFEVGGNYKTYKVLGTDVDVNNYSYLAGPRYAFRGNKKVTPYAQFLVGANRVSANSASATDFAVQPGIGADVWVSPNVGVRFGGDYRRAFTEGDGTNLYRFHVGLVVSVK